MKKYLPWLILFAFVNLSLEAQNLSSDEDIFAEGAFDSAVAAGQASEEVNKLVWLGGVSLASTTTLVIPEALDAYGSQGQWAGKGFLKASNPSVGSLFLSYTYLHTLWAASDDDTLAAGYARARLDPSTPRYTLSEFHLSFDVGKIVFVRLGNQLIDWGASAVWSPADFINRNTDPNGALDSRAGKPGLRIHLPWAGGNFFAFADASGSLSKAGVPRDLTKTGTLGLKADGTWAGWNIGLIGNFGREAGPRLGITTVGALFGFDLWGEAGAVWKGTRSWSASVGGERTFGTNSEWTARVEGFWNPSGRSDEGVAGAMATFVPYYWSKAYVYAEVLKKKFIGPDVTGSLSTTANLADRSFVATASLRTTFSGVPPFSLFTQYNGGSSDREFTWTTGGPAWTLGLRSVLEF